MKFVSIGIFLCILSFSSQAQKQSSFWFNAYYGLDFNTYPPNPISLRASTNYQNNVASVADSLGNLLFFTEGILYYDRDGVVMPNSPQFVGMYPFWYTAYIPFIIAPVPESKTRFYVFTIKYPISNGAFDYDRTLRYSIVDMTLNNGKGDLAVVGKEIAYKQGDQFTLMKTPEDKGGYWLISMNQLNAKALASYRINAEGIAKSPVVSPVDMEIDTTCIIKPSPNGKFLVLRNVMNDATHRLMVMAFDGEKGTFKLHREIRSRGTIYNNAYPNSQVHVGAPEFSPDSRYLYLVEDSVYSTERYVTQCFNTLVSYDLSAPSEDQFKKSRQVIYTFPEFKFPIPGSLQLTPQGKIIVSDLVNDFSFHTIHYPNACSVQDKGFERNSIPTGATPYSLTPLFPHWYFYQPLLGIEDFAGEDKVVCSNEEVTMGTAAKPGYTYQWDPTPGLTNLNSPMPLYLSSENISGVNDTITLHLMVTSSIGCKQYDSVHVVVLARNEWMIQGSKSVCPGIKEVKYWIDNGWDGKSLTWSVEGGVVSKKISMDTVLVDWGESNLNAFVTASAESRYGCPDIVKPFPVKIFKSLETEKPMGRDTLLCRQFTEPYKIIGTNGSLYDWQVSNGLVIEGQGFNKVKITWDENSLTGAVWINESVNTSLETCFGKSDTLHIINPNKMLRQNISLNTISVSECCNDLLDVHYKVSNTVFYKSDVEVLRRDFGTSDWATIGTVDKKDSIVIFEGQPLNEKMMEYRLVAQNICSDTASSATHRNILLQADVHEANNFIDLSWNPYVSWPSGVKDYTFKKSYDSVATAANGVSLDNNTFTYHHEKISDSFLFSFRVLAAPNDKTFYPSLSNTITLAFENKLFVPNVVTPNGDGKNDVWKPFPIELYPENELIIFNRWGQQVYKKQNYTGDWGGIDVEDGIYFYELKTVQKNRYYKGFVQVIR